MDEGGGAGDADHMLFLSYESAVVTHETSMAPVCKYDLRDFDLMKKSYVCEGSDMQ